MVTKLSKSLHSKAKPSKSDKGPVWEGPVADGITYSLLCRFLCCRERFRLLVVEGLKPVEQFNHRIEYGQMWHTCEEALAQADGTLIQGTEYCWTVALNGYVSGLCKKYPLQQEQIQHWYNVCCIQFPVYVDYWSRHPDVTNRTSLLQEQVFDVPYQLPSGRIIRLRGKWDSVDLIGKGKAASVYLFETKTKGDVKEEQLQRQLSSGFDLQTMLYLVAIERSQGPVFADGVLNKLDARLSGVRYNVIHRPLSGGKDSIRQKQNESPEEFYVRLRALIIDHPDYYFMRWKVEVTPQDIIRFRRECLDPILEELCDWWGNVARVSDPFVNNALPTGAGRHWRHPFGVYNVLDEGGAGELDEYLATGSTLGLERVSNLFRELDDD